MTESNALSRARLIELREAVETGTISWGETAELQAAFEEIPESELPEPREHASFGDMLDELEQRLPPEPIVAYALAQTAAGGYPVIIENAPGTTLADAIEGAKASHGGEWHEASDAELADYRDYFKDAPE